MKKKTQDTMTKWMMEPVKRRNPNTETKIIIITNTRKNRILMIGRRNLMIIGNSIRLLVMHMMMDLSLMMNIIILLKGKEMNKRRKIILIPKIGLVD